MRDHLLVLLAFLLVGAAWSWPAPLLDADQLAVRHFDLMPVVWLVERAPQLGLDLHHAASSFPEGETLARLDSWVLLALAWLNHGLLSGAAVAMLLCWWGPALSAFAAERCAALAFEVPRPWSVAAGLAYGFSGVAASAALEGHVPHLLEPWLPLCLGAAWLAGGPRGRVAHGLLAGLGAALALLTTAYHGLVACLVLAVLGLRALRAGRLAALLPAAAPLLVVGGWLAWTWTAGQGESVEPRRVVALAELGSASLEQVLSWRASHDLALHSVGMPLGGLVVLGLVAGVRRRSVDDRWLLSLCLLALLLALGPTWRLLADGAGVPSPLRPLWASTPVGAVLRFPVRFAWALTLAGGILAAQALARSGAPRWLLLVLLLDPFLGTGMPARQARQALPPGLGEGEGAVLDLFPVAIVPEQSDIEMWARNLSCARQVAHGRPVLERCIGTSVQSPRLVVQRWLHPQLLDERPDPELAARLAALGIGSVVVHRRFFQPGEGAQVEAALAAALGPPLREQEELVLYGVPGPAGAEAARRALAALPRAP